jgi:hypothetical protein
MEELLKATRSVHTTLVAVTIAVLAFASLPDRTGKYAAALT